MTNDKYVGMDAHPATIMAEVLNGNGRVLSTSIMAALRRSEVSRRRSFGPASAERQSLSARQAAEPQENGQTPVVARDAGFVLIRYPALKGRAKIITPLRGED